MLYVIIYQLDLCNIEIKTITSNLVYDSTCKSILKYIDLRDQSGVFWRYYGNDTNFLLFYIIRDFRAKSLVDLSQCFMFFVKVPSYNPDSAENLFKW